MAISKKANKLLNSRLKLMDRSIDSFMSDIPSIQKKVFRDLVNRLKDLETNSDGTIKATISNLRKAQSINVFKGLILTDKYITDSHKFVDSFDDVKSKTDSYFEEL